MGDTNCFGRGTLKKVSVYNIIFQHPVILVNDLTCRGNLESQTLILLVDC
jgi:hypothetical protein